MEHDEFGQTDRQFIYRVRSRRLNASWWQRLFPWEPPTIDLYSPLQPEELLVIGNLAPHFWQKLPFGEKLARLGKEKDTLKPAWWQRVFFWMSMPDPAWSIYVIRSLEKMEKNDLKPAWWQRPFQRMPKLPD